MNKNRLTEYFKELEEKTKNENTNLTDKFFGIGGSLFSNTPINSESVFFFDGKSYNNNGNPIDIEEDKDPSNWWKNEKD